MEYITPSTPPAAQTPNVSQNGKLAHQPTMIRPGSTKITELIAPADEATVCTMLFSCRVTPLTRASRAMEITAAGIEVAKVRPTLRPR